MAAMLERALDVPVVVENDVNLAVLGERWKGAARGHDTCAFVTVGTGIGAGVVIRGSLHRGHHGMAGEIGLMCMGAQYADRDFGDRGCLETLAGLDALAARWRRGSIDRNRRKGWLARLFEAAEQGDRRARLIVEETARLIGMATANLSLVIDPSLIVLGGVLATRGPLLIQEARRIARRIVPVPPRIVVSALGSEAPLWGCLLVAVTEAHDRLRLALTGTLELRGRRP